MTISANNNTDVKKFTLYTLGIWLLAASFYFYEYLVQIIPNIFAPTFIALFHIKAWQLGILGSSYFVMYVLMQIPAGIMLDNFGVRKSLLSATLLCALGSILLAFATDLRLAIIARVITGTGSAFAVLTTLKIAVDWLPRKFFNIFAGFTLAIGTLGASVGSVLLQTWQYHSTTQTILLTCGVLGLILFFLTLFIVSDKKGQQTTTTNVTISITEKLGLALKELIQLVKSTNNWLASLYMAFFYAPISVLGTLWGHSFLLVKYQHLTTYENSLLFFGITIGTPLTGFLTQQVFNRFKFMLFGAGLASIILFEIIYGHHSLIISNGFYFLYGLIAGSFVPIYAIIYEQNSAAHKATAMAFLNMASMTLGGIVFQGSIGAALDYFWSGKMNHGIRIYSLQDYQHALTILPISTLLALICMSILFYRYKKTRD